MSLNLKMQLFGERVLFEPVEEELSGSIQLPERTNKSYELGRVLLVGDGKVKDKDGKIIERKLLVKPGDIVWFQVTPIMAANCALRIQGKTYLTVLQHDLIGRLKNTTVSLENFEILGHWILVDTFEDRDPGSMLHIPDTVNNPEVRMLRYFVKQKGELAEGFEVGDEVILEKRAAQIVAFNNEPYFYIDGRHVYGVCESSPELEKAKKDKEELAKARAFDAGYAKHLKVK